jgi:hypothetical protein
MSQRITIQCNPANPVNYLACCGLFDLLARMDAGTLGWWHTKAPVAFLLESEVTEADFLATVLPSLSSASCWRFGRAPAGEVPVRVVVQFASPGKPPFSVALDWWFETAELDGTIREKSAWKMYAGNQSLTQIITERMIPACAAIREERATPMTAIWLLEASYNLTGRFGFDPRGAVNAMDRGYSPDGVGEPVPTFPFSELLATFGLHSFFPSRTGPAGRVQSTRGWRGADDGEGEKGFAYCLWLEPVPVPLARLAAVRPTALGTRTLFAPRAMRKNYSNLTLARTIQSTVTP